MRALKKTKVAKRAFTLIETLIVLLLLGTLLVAAGFVFQVSLRAWDSGCTRGGIREDLNYGTQKVLMDLKEMANASLSQYSSIAHTIQYDDLSGDTYVLYLYNADDATLDSTYGESLYDLYKADVDRGDTPASGDGVLILRDLVSPDAAAPATALTISNNQITLDFVVQRDDETVRLKTKVRPRNL